MEELKDVLVHVHCIANYRVSAFFYRYRRDALGMDEGKVRAEMEAIWDRRVSGPRLSAARPISATGSTRSLQWGGYRISASIVGAGSLAPDRRFVTLPLPLGRKPGARRAKRHRSNDPKSLCASQPMPDIHVPRASLIR